MNTETVLTNARIVTPEGVTEGSLCLQDGLIADIHAGSSHCAEDMRGDYIIPGLIEMHTDHLETQFQPRPGVLWPSRLAALLAHDTQVVGAGITTVLDSVCCGQLNEGNMRRTLLSMSIEAIRDARKKDVLRADHLLHLRCEICDQHMLDMFEPYAEEENLRLVSLMDHTPGQRQFRNLDKYKEYYRVEDMPETEFQSMIDRLKTEQVEFADKHRAAVLALCSYRGIPVASHDDTTEEHVAEAFACGITISEFPTTMEAARAARAKGLGIVMGAPNVVRGGSHSGNVSARTLAAEGLLDILSSDYVPASLLHGAFLLHSDLGVPLQDALSTVTSNPARLLKLDDRGEIALGKRADVVRVRVVDDVPVVRGVWRNGERLL
ncbi:alpha-D-ribose 1-methylphosphonate 5-triphosphate diphosphatase [Oleidesulfovibrio sp.]|uniref:alpha-D-ribose 1-methylphosphonate 5-triphosphate diphosphatase n=1 Tax=Oleidesulfovibrio sp. TaxID=2909707 RepID=UPI003A879AB8